MIYIYFYDFYALFHRMYLRREVQEQSSVSPHTGRVQTNQSAQVSATAQGKSYGTHLILSIIIVTLISISQYAFALLIFHSKYIITFIFYELLLAFMMMEC